MTRVLGLRTVIYHVPDLKRAKEWYGVAFGAKPYATVVDPFGNLIGLIQNPHFGKDEGH